MPRAAPDHPPAVADPLDNPIWNSLIGPQAAIANGTAEVLRYPNDISLFHGVPDPLGHGVAALADVTGPGDAAVFITTEPTAVPIDFAQVFQGAFHQMVCSALTQAPPSIGDAGVVELTADDVGEMLTLVRLTEPGPFLPRTHTLGRYIGIRHDGALVAMAGQRMRVDGATEVSAVCTHPDARGRGYAARLVRALTAQIHAGGEHAFLHVSVDNAGARAVYERLGYETRTFVTIQAFLRKSVP
ncbi:unannotated protein [freshwater metagenome]|uniref:Unannotated protein n=1 Tax=freshwater metagenome TaxID=449393 RepID=A0A6J7FQV3_9ZZZZ|nr:GNAT family N-acetyltransferase [Actinomycetota bacterium]